MRSSPCPFSAASWRSAANTPGTVSGAGRCSMACGEGTADAWQVNAGWLGRVNAAACAAKKLQTRKQWGAKPALGRWHVHPLLAGQQINQPSHKTARLCALAGLGHVPGIAQLLVQLSAPPVERSSSLLRSMRGCTARGRAECKLPLLPSFTHHPPEPRLAHS